MPRLIDWILIALIVLALAGAVGILIRNRRRGKSCSGCTGDCSTCSKHRDGDS